MATLTATVNPRPTVEEKAGAKPAAGANPDTGKQAAKVADDPKKAEEVALRKKVREDVTAEVAAAAEAAKRAAVYASEKAKYFAAASWNASVAFLGSLSVDFLVVVVTLGLLALITFIYLKLNPTVLLPNTEFYNQCPDRWIFREDNYAGGNEVGGNSTPLPNRNPNPSLPGMPTLFSTQVVGKCWPTYQTTCQPFDPSLYTANRCDIAKSCGTTWTGLCP